VARLKQVKGVGTLIALTFLLTLEDVHRFGKSRDVGCYLGLQPGRRNSGQSEPQMHISKEGDPYMRTLLVQGRHHTLGPFGADSDLRRWGLKLAERGGKNGKKRAVIATARKLAVLLHRLWVSGEVYERCATAVRSCCRQPRSGDPSIRRTKAQTSSSGDCVNRLAQLPFSGWNWRSIIRWQHRLNREHPPCTERTKAHQECGWKGGEGGNSAGEKTLSNEQTTKPT
jgi:Transposase IS116/IS110/IS902 family